MTPCGSFRYSTVISFLYSKVIALDGKDYKTIWNITFDKSESYATIAVGYYDEDEIPDFLVKYQYGRGFPVYEYEQVSPSYIFSNIVRLNNKREVREYPLIPYSFTPIFKATSSLTKPSLLPIAFIVVFVNYTC